jgi:hypothetical protein
MRSGVTPASLPKGFFAQLTNLRFDEMQLKVRDGALRLTSAVPVGSASLRGAYSCNLQGSPCIVAAYRVGSFTQVWRLDATAFTWSEITHDGTTNARNGNTRFATDGQITYAVILDQAGKEILLIQNGADFPRVYDPSQAANERVAIHQPITPPTSTTEQRILLDFPQVANLWESGTRSSTTYVASSSLTVTAATNATPIVLTTSAAHGLATGATVAVNGVLGNTAANGIWTLTVTGSTTFALDTSVGNGAYTSGGKVFAKIGITDTGTGQNLIPTMLISPSVATSDSVYIDLSPTAATLHLHQARQLVMILNEDYGALWSNLKIEIGAFSTGFTWVTLYDPSSTQYDPAFVTDVDPNEIDTYAVAFSTDGLDKTVAQVTSTMRFKFTWVGAQPPSTPVEVKFLLLAASGTVQGGSSYGLTWRNSQSRAESYGQIVDEPTCAYIQQRGGTPSNGLRIPNSEILYYRAAVYYQDVSAVEIGKGTDTLCIYRKDPGESRYSFASSTVVNTFSAGSWSTGFAGQILEVDDTVATSAKDPTRIMPDAYHQCIPTGSSLLASGGRLFVGGVGAAKGELWVSEEFGSTKFRTTVRFLDSKNADPTSPTRVSFPGEIMTGLASVGGGLIGVDPVFAFTQGNVYRMDGLDAASLSKPTRVGRHGCPWPRTIAERLGELYWVDNERQVRTMRGSQMLPVSKLKIDDKLKIANLQNASGATMGERYYLAYQPSGGSTNTNVLIYEERLGEWCEDVLASGDAGQLVTIDDPLQRKIYSFSNAGHVYRIESPGQATDDGTALPITITTPEIHGEMWQSVFPGAVGVVSDVTAATLTITRSWRPSASGHDGTINLASASGTAWLWEHCANEVKPGGSGLSCQIAITGTLPAGFRFYALVSQLDIDAEGDARVG